MCWMLEDPEQALHIGGEALTCMRTVPLAWLNVQLGLESLTLISSLPVGGFEVKLTQVLLQPAAAIHRSSAPLISPSPQARKDGWITLGKQEAIEYPG